MKMGILKKYGDGLVMPELRYRQFVSKSVQMHKLVVMDMVGWVRDGGKYWILCREDERYVRISFAPNDIWFEALCTIPILVVVKDLPQIILI